MRRLIPVAAPFHTSRNMTESRCRLSLARCTCSCSRLFCSPADGRSSLHIPYPVIDFVALSTLRPARATLGVSFRYYTSLSAALIFSRILQSRSGLHFSSPDWKSVADAWVRYDCHGNVLARQRSCLGMKEAFSRGFHLGAGG